MTDAQSSPRLSIGLAIQEGWQTFRRAPWPFVFFALAAFILSTVVDQIPGVAGIIATTLVDLWATIGIMRGAWIGLNGNPPRFRDFIAINPGAIWRLFSRQFILAILLLVIGFAVFWLALIAADANEILGEADVQRGRDVKFSALMRKMNSVMHDLCARTKGDRGALVGLGRSRGARLWQLLQPEQPLRERLPARVHRRRAARVLFGGLDDGARHGAAHDDTRRLRRRRQHDSAHDDTSCARRRR